NRFIILRGGREDREERDGRVLGTMSQDRHQHAAAAVIQDPGMMTERPISPIVNRTKAITTLTKLASGLEPATGPKKMSRCHTLQSAPRMRVPTSGPYRRCKRGSAKPRHPPSSSSGPPGGMKRTETNELR